MQKTAVYTVHYRLKNELAEVVDTSEGGEPMHFLIGTDRVIKGIQEAVRDRAPGDCLEVTIPAGMAYGEHRADLVRKVPRSAFEGVENLHVGMTFQTNTAEDAQVVKVVGIDGNLILVDANHPLAGLTLHFDLEIMARREATEEEIEAGEPLY